jgi:membrane protein YdbS with pleckstrin-like domain
MFEPPSLRVIVIWIVGALTAGGAVLAYPKQSLWPAVIILLLTMCVTVLVLPQDD